jgi:hypothetical protein
MRHFGAPLVDNVQDFGLRSAAPVHQGLLDWLAVEFMESGWRMKHLHRLLVTSNTYMQRSDATGATAAANRSIDEANRYWWRMHPRRMEAELVRDGLLHLAGRLDETMGGEDLDPATAEKLGRRSVYFRHTPNDKALMLEMFDAADPAECYRRSESVVPHQALALANGGMALDHARLIAGSIFAQVADVAENQREAAFVNLSFETVLCRGPGAAELAECMTYLREMTGTLAEAKGLTAFEAGEPAGVKPAVDPRQRAREGLVHVLFNHHDFVTIW